MAVEMLDRVASKHRESWEDAIWRLAAEAHEAGIKLYHCGCAWFATSQSDPELLHRVTLVSCDCPGFAHYQRCRHLAALIQYTGNMPQRPDEPAADVTTTARCVNCFGSGWVGQEDRWEGECPQCGGTGRLIIHWGAHPVSDIASPPRPAA